MRLLSVAAALFLLAMACGAEGQIVCGPSGCFPGPGRAMPGGQVALPDTRFYGPGPLRAQQFYGMSSWSYAPQIPSHHVVSYWGPSPNWSVSRYQEARPAFVCPLCGR